MCQWNRRDASDLIPVKALENMLDPEGASSPRASTASGSNAAVGGVEIFEATDGQWMAELFAGATATPTRTAGGRSAKPSKAKKD